MRNSTGRGTGGNTPSPSGEFSTPEGIPLSCILMILEFKLLLLIVFANGAPILARHLLGTRFDLPIDGGRTTTLGYPWLGPSKTFRGVIAAVITSSLIAYLLGFTWTFGMIIGSLVMLGDLLASFIKRRLGLPSSSQAPGLDQIPESLIPLFYSASIFNLGWQSILLTVVAFWVSEILLSRLLFKLGVRRHPY